jgi:hypothetical protein
MATNVWQIGATLRCLVLKARNPVQSLFLDGALDTTYLVQGMPEVAAYSLPLLQLIEDMMQYNVAARPTCTAILAQIAALPPGYDRGMRNGSAGNPPNERLEYDRVDIYAPWAPPPLPLP